MSLNRIVRLLAGWALGSLAVSGLSVTGLSVTGLSVTGLADEPLPPIQTRFAPDATGQYSGTEVPGFQRHVSPLLGRLGCNGRACHGSFQGRGDFRLSLFGFDFEADHRALSEHGRIAPDQPLESLVLTKPVDADKHEGGQRFEQNSWQYWVLRKWIEARAPFDPQQVETLKRLEVQPSSLVMKARGDTQPLKVLAHWQSGQVEDVTCLCRFQSNDPAVASVDDSGMVTAGDTGDSHIVVSYDNGVVPVEVLRPYSELDSSNRLPVTHAGRVDELVSDKLRRMGIVPSELATDEEFLRRASLDVTGTLPTAAEVLAFLADTTADKRARKIDELLERPGYAAQWATFFCDMTGNNDDQLRNFLPVQRGDLPASQWYQWIHQRLEKNVPYDELVEGIVTAKSRLPNESYSDYCQAMTEICQDRTGEKFAARPGLVHYWARQNFRTPEEKAIGFAYTFLGVRIQCAQCHKHPFDQWTKADFENFERLFVGIQGNQNSMTGEGKKQAAAMVSELGIDKSLKGNQLRKELALKLQAGQVVPFPELVVNSKAAAKGKQKKDKDKAQAGSEPATQARLLGGEWVALDQADIRSKLMAWLRAPENPYFAKALVNRVWAHYFSIGIVNPSDDLNLANAPSNAALLDYLATGFVEHDFDLKWLHREILNSHTYQRSWVTNSTNHLDKRNFSHSLLRRLPAEAAHDAVLMALGNDQRAADVVNANRSRALTTGGASPIVKGGDTSYALSVFGRSVRESNCDCDRSNEPSLLQTVFLLNDAAVHTWLTDTRRGWVASIARKHGWTYQPGSPAAKPDATVNDASDNERLDDQVAEATQLSDSNHEPTAAAMTTEQARSITDQAYLRTLSRHPKPEELTIAVDFLCSQPDPAQAVESLIWGIVNTKEFILNH